MTVVLRNLIIILAIFVSSSCKVFATDFYELGKIHYYKENYKNANHYFEKALRENPLNVNYRYYYAQSYVYLNDLNKAQEEYEKIIAISPDSNAAKLATKAILNLHNYYVALNNRKYTSSSGNFVSASKSSTLGDNYLENAVTNTGDILLWNLNEMPLKIFFIDGKTKNGFKPDFVAKVKQAFDVWKNASENKLSFKYTYDKKKAHMVVSFEPSLSNNNSSKGFIAGLTKPYPGDEYLKVVTMRFATTRPDGRPITSTDLYNTAVHEIGHSLGIWGHSDNENDIMYPVKKEEGQESQKILSQRDINTIKSLYTMSKDEIASGMNSSGDNTIGSKEDRLSAKLKEAQDYVKKVPNDPISWTQLAVAYMNLNKIQEAITNYEKALGMDPSYKSAHEGLGEIYTKQKDVRKAEKHYNFLIKKYPIERKHYHNFAVLYIQNKQYSKAKYIINKLYSADYSARKDSGFQKLMNIAEKELN